MPADSADPHKYSEILQRIQSALEASRKIFERFTPGKIAAEYKAAMDPVTEADLAVNNLLHKELLRKGEGWLSEESVDDLSRLQQQRMWIVDPLDGTREFVAGIPEYCISIAYAENGRAVAGGICNPATGEVFLGAIGLGTIYNGKPVKASEQSVLRGATILASRSETKRGEWKRFDSAEFNVRQMGSVAYKLALVAAGLADATFSLVPKHEWDVAAGAALIESAGGFFCTLDDTPLHCNREKPLIRGLVAGAPGLRKELMPVVRSAINS
ncbi:MAG TPA: 3'(2'),5'-bisphosphate nucleotidase CysQ [Terriglobales bacterium]|nr:3'(2'),5'-bisphosphate nucleotidase CysQ [Terriglobales bacterium]